MVLFGVAGDVGVFGPFSEDFGRCCCEDTVCFEVDGTTSGVDDSLPPFIVNTKCWAKNARRLKHNTIVVEANNYCVFWKIII